MDLELFWGLLRVILALAVIVPAAIFATRWYGKRQVRTGSVRIKEAVGLGANRALYLVEWEGKELLLGVTNQSITLLDKQLRQETEEVHE